MNNRAVQFKRLIITILYLELLILVNTGQASAADDPQGNTDKEDVVWFVPTEEKVIALTFDDGPDPVFTPKVLDVLAKYNVNGTFFVIGECVDKHPETAKMIVEQGSEIANHSYTHVNVNSISTARVKEEIEKTDEAILAATGVQPHLFRPPHGVYNETLIEIIHDKNYKVVLWSWTQDTLDWCNPGTDYIINKVLNNVQNGDIIIFHDGGGNRSQTVAALDIIIRKLQEQDYKLMTVSELLTHGKEDTPAPELQDVFIYE